ncbi:MAG: methyl-accepting chemotaxis protein [Oscillospiraceae bacterium]
MLKNMKIGKRLIITFLLVVAIASFSGLTGINLITKFDDGYGKALTENGFVLADIGNYNTELNKAAALTRDIIILTDPTAVKNARSQLAEVDKRSSEAFIKAAENCTTPEEQEIITKIKKAAPKYMAARDKAIELGLQDRSDEGMRVFRDDAVPFLNICENGGTELMELNIKMGDAASKDLTQQGVISVAIMWGVLAVSIVISVVLAVIISKGISNPIDEIKSAAEKMAKGDYDVDVHYQSKDEMGILANNMRDMMATTKGIIFDTSRGLTEIAAGNFDIAPQVEYVGVFEELEAALVKIITGLSETMSQIKIAADQVSSGSDQVSSGAQALAQGATEQASSVEELSASINGVSQQIEHNAESALTANKSAEVVGSKIDTSNAQMAQMMSAMTNISTSSSEISKIIKTIEDIAFQTNILALNAAVEAARAGAAGKGFAVVADEVRNLATKSSEAAKQTNVLIEGSVKAVENGVNIAHETSKSLAEVVSGAKQITDLIGQISAASAEQSTSIAQINLGVEQISSVVQTNSATSEESAAASEELNGQATMLRTLVSKFVLFSGGKGAAEKPKVAFTAEPTASYPDDFADSKY